MPPSWRYRRCIVCVLLKTAAPRAGLLVVSILTTNASADQADGAERIELYGMLKIGVSVDGRTKPGRGLRYRSLEIIWISHIGPQALGNELCIYEIRWIAELFTL